MNEKVNASYTMQAKKSGACPEGEVLVQVGKKNVYDRDQIHSGEW